MSQLPDGPLTGVPFLVKNLKLQLEGTITTDSTKLHEGKIATATSLIAQRYEASGLQILNKTNSPEFGIMGTTEPELHGSTKNPWNLNHTPGGSSGGASASVAAAMVPAAHAGDGGGSIRIPCRMLRIVRIEAYVVASPRPICGRKVEWIRAGACRHPQCSRLCATIGHCGTTHRRGTLCLSTEITAISRRGFFLAQVITRWIHHGESIWWRRAPRLPCGGSGCSHAFGRPRTHRRRRNPSLQQRRIGTCLLYHRRRRGCSGR